MSTLEYYAGIDIGASNIKYGIVNSNGEIIFRDRKPARVDKGAVPLLHLITNIAENLLLRASEEDVTVPWLGIGSPGTVDNLTGTIKGNSPNIPDWVGTKISEHLRDHLNMPVYVDNDANAMALAELRFGAAKRFNSAVCITLGTGIGSGIILNKQLWRGNDFSAGEIGHIVIEQNGKKCRCGNNGCLEAYCSSRAILDRTREKCRNGMSEILGNVLDNDLENLTVKKMFAAAKKGDKIALEVVEETGTILGAGLSGVVNLLNPEALIFGGGIIDGGAGLLEIIGAEIRRRSFAAASENLRILRADLGNDAGFIGAGLLGEYKTRNG